MPVLAYSLLAQQILLRLGAPYLPAARRYRLIQSVYLKPDFESGGKNEGGKPGFRFGGGSAPSGGSWLPTGLLHVSLTSVNKHSNCNQFSDDDKQKCKVDISQGIAYSYHASERHR